MTELERNKRISKEFKRINRYFKELGENKKSLVLPLIQNAAFMRVTLDDLQEIISEQGPVEAYQNGQNQYGMKQSAALQSYNTTVKNYAAVIKNLFSLLPSEQQKAVSISEIYEISCEERREKAEDVQNDFKLAVEYQQWQREQEKAGKRVDLSFQQWKDKKRKGGT